VRTQTRKARIIDLPVMASNSTVNGYKAQPRRSARCWLDGWRGLGLRDSRVYKDGAARILRYKDSNYFGAGRKAGLSCGEYLHVPVLGDNEHRVYRVRCKFYPGRKFRGREVMMVQAVLDDGVWYWRLTCKNR
jgi:hypothetical protein